MISSEFTYKQNDFLTSLDTLSLSADGTSVKDSLLHYATYGVGDAVISGAVGLYNTGVALGEAIGVLDEGNQVDEQKAIKNTLGDNAEAFYTRHKEGIDLTGFVLSAIVPGTLAVKALRTGMNYGRLTEGMQLATGLRNAETYAAARQAALAAPKASLWTNPVVQRAYLAQGTQQFLEVAAFDAATILATNQNAFINRESQGYFEATWNQTKEFAPYTIGFGAVFAGAAVLKTKGILSRVIGDEFKAAAPAAASVSGSYLGMLSGDALVDLSRQAELHKASFTATDNIILNRQYKIGDKVIDQTAQELIGKLNVAGKDAGDYIYKQFLDAPVTGEFADTFAMAKSVSYGSGKDLQDGIKFFTPVEGKLPTTRAPYGIVEAETKEELQLKMQTLIKELGGTLPEGAVVDSRQFIKIVNQQLVNAAPEIKDRLIMMQLAEIKTADSAAKRELNKLLDAELKSLSHQKISGSSRNSVLTQLLNAGYDAAPALFKNFPIDAKPLNFKNLSEHLQGPIGKNIDLSSLFALGGELMTSPASRAAAATKYPELAKFLELHGLADKPWNTVTAYKNMRTGTTSSAALLDFADIPGAITVKDGVLNHAGLGKSYKFDSGIFGLADNAAGIGALKGEKYLDYSAAWHIAAIEEFKGVDEAGRLLIESTALPKLERAIVEWERSPNLMKDILMGDRQFTTAAEARKYLQDQKFVRKARLVERGINENVIAKVLNMEVKDLQQTHIPDKLLMAEKDYTKPEWIKIGYEARKPKDFSDVAFIKTHVEGQKKLLQEEFKTAVTKAVGDKFLKIMPKPLEEEISALAAAKINPQSPRVSTFGGLTTEVGTLRERANLIFKGQLKYKTDEQAAIRERLDGAATALNSKGPEAQLLRAELVKFTNTLRGGNYAIEQADEVSYLVSKEAIDLAESRLKDETAKRFKVITEEQKAKLGSFGLDEKAIKKELARQREVLERAAEADAKAILGERYIFDAAEELSGGTRESIIQLSPRMSGIARKFHEEQLAADSKSRELSKVMGFSSSSVPNRYLRPPQPDLTKSKFNAFVVPSVFNEGSDARKFMIFADTEAEFAAKLNAVEAHPDFAGYKVVSTKTETALYKKMLGEYQGDSLFHSVIFDSSQARKGETKELVSNLDLNTSSTFELWHNHIQKRNSAIIDEALKVYYRNELDTLNRLDLAESAITKDIVASSLKESDSIWKDTANLYLGRRSFNSGFENLYGKVSDFVGTKGSLVLDRTFDLFFGNKTAALSPENYNKYNKALQDMGYKNPMTDYFGTILTSPDVGVSQSLSTYMRVLSNLHSTFMLRLDPLNNMMQVISAPILALPVVREVSKKLSSGDLDLLLRVQNPAGGTEPSAGKLLATSLAEYAKPNEATRAFITKLEDRGIITDFIREYHLTTDFAELNGRHTAKIIDQKIAQIATFGGKWAGFNVAEEATRFTVANSVWKLMERAGYKLDEAMPVIAGAVDKVHGVYSDAVRAGLFRGVVGQGVGLYMTYFFNLMQQFGRGLTSGDRKFSAMMAATQSSIFGLGSLPGMNLLNNQLAKDFGGDDLYGLSGADAGDGFGEYMMYGLASNVWGFNVDVFSRGDLTPRHTTVVPLNPVDWAVVGRTASIASNLAQTVGNVAESISSNTGPGVAESLAFGLAHNGLNRPLQGVGALLAGEVTTRSGQVLTESRGFSEDAVISTWVARLIGSRPTAEGIALDSMYRKTAYQAAVKDKIKSIGGDLQLKLQNGEDLDGETVGDFMKEYTNAGGDLANFNKFWVSQMRGFSQPQLDKFREELTQDTLTRNLYYQMR